MDIPEGCLDALYFIVEYLGYSPNCEVFDFFDSKYQELLIDLEHDEKRCERLEDRYEPLIAALELRMTLDYDGNPSELDLSELDLFERSLENPLNPDFLD
jgi:hypothetical protein